MEQPIRVAVIEPVGGHGGMDYYDFGLCDSLADAGVDVVLHTCDETLIPAHGRYGVRHTYVGIYGKLPTVTRGLRYLRGTLAALWSARRERRGIVHFHLFHVGLLETFNILMARLLGRRVVITAHDVESFVEKLEVPMLSRWIYRIADQVVAHNRISRSELIGRIGLVDKKISVIAHGNYLHMARPLPSRFEARATLGLPAEAKVMLFFGQIKEVKGLDLLLDAMAEVLKAYPEARLLIAGKPWKSDFAIYEEQMRKLGIADQCITHIHYIPDDKVADYYAAADLVVLPYRRTYQSGVVLMAMSYGKPVLVSNIAGMVEVVRDNESGFVFTSGDVVSLAQTICRIFSDSDATEAVANRGYAKVKEQYDWRVIGQQTKELYARLA